MKIKTTLHPNKKYKKFDYVVLFICVVWMCYLFCSVHHGFLYDDPDYVCRHMARDLENNLESLGIDTEIVSNGDHMWIKVFGIEFDSVSLLPGFAVSTCTENRNITVYNNYEESMARYAKT